MKIKDNQVKNFFKELKNGFIPSLKIFTTCYIFFAKSGKKDDDDLEHQYMCQCITSVVAEHCGLSQKVKITLAALPALFLNVKV